MTAKEYLRKVKRMETAIRQKEGEIKYMREAATHISVNYGSERVQSSPAYDRLADSVAKIVDMEAEIVEEYQKMLAFRAEAAERIGRLPKELQSQILFLRYLEGKSMKEIPGIVGRSSQYVVEQHGKALQAFKILNPDLFEGDKSE